MLEADELIGSPAEPETTGRRPSMEPPPPTSDTVMTGSMEGQAEVDSLSAAGDGSDATETTDTKKESAKYIEKRRYV